MRSMLALQPVWEVTTAHGEEPRRRATTTTGGLCQDDDVSPTLVDKNGDPLCFCENIGD